MFFCFFCFYCNKDSGKHRKWYHRALVWFLRFLNKHGPSCIILCGVCRSVFYSILASVCNRNLILTMKDRLWMPPPNIGNSVVADILVVCFCYSSVMWWTVGTSHLGSTQNQHPYPFINFIWALPHHLFLPSALIYPNISLKRHWYMLQD